MARVSSPNEAGEDETKDTKNFIFEGAKPQIRFERIANFAL
jgi:hypothetical protein